jgi:leucyl/phenylalanyl-tRNA--protein transferase
MGKRQIVFPDVSHADSDGLLAVGGDLQTDTIRAAYERGIFPWPISLDFPLAWFSPDPRGVLDLDDFHLPHSFKKWLKKIDYTVTFSQDFSKVISSCARVPRKGQAGTWITPDITKGYSSLFEEGNAYSVEVWDKKELIGGLYGVCFGGYVSGESMFSLKTSASKLALVKLISLLQENGIDYLDTQMVTPVVELFGGKYIPREDFISRLRGVDWNLNRDEIFKYKKVLDVD